MIRSAILFSLLGQAQVAQPAANAWPQWSPDGAHIVFASSRDGDWEIYVMRADGLDARRLTVSPGRDAHPMFMPDGRRIVFQSPRGHSVANQVDLYVMDSDGQNPHRIVSAAGFNGVPVPSPDGMRIAFQRSPIPGADGAYHWQLFLVDSTGRDERQVTANPWSSQVPTWSPDGRRLAFYADPGGGRNQLFVMDLESQTVTPLAASAGADNAPAWSPDGRSIAFISTRDGPRDLYRADLATGTVIRLTHGLDIWGQPSWSPDSRRLLFSAKATGTDQVYVIDVDGSGLARLTGPQSYILVALSGRDSLVALHGQTLERLFAVSTGAGPHEVAVTPDGRRAFVANTRGASISTIDLGRRAPGPTLPLGAGADPHDVELDADGRTLWVTVAGQRALFELDSETGEIRRRWALPADGGWMVDAGSAAGPVVVAHLEGGGLTLLRRSAGRMDFVSLEAGEIEAQLAPDGATIWSVNMQAGRVTVSASDTRQRVAAVPSGGSSPVRVVLTPDGRTAVVAHASAGEAALVLLDAHNPTARTEIALPHAPKVLAVSAEGRRLYVTHPEPGAVTLIDLAARRVVTTAPLCGAPDGVAVVR